jgi:heterodisulfide reductase subunit A
MPARIGVYICHCGINIAATVDVEEVVRFAQTLPNVVVARHYTYMCSDPGQALIKQDIEEYKLNRVVVASCSPRMHEPTFRSVVAEKGVNPYQFEMANIREQNSWVHSDVQAATQKAKELVAAAVAKVALLEPLEEREVEITPAALVIGGGIAGLTAALDIAEAGYKVYLVEKEPTVGGRMAQLSRTFPAMEDARHLLAERIKQASSHPNIEILTSSTLREIEGYIGNFKATILRRPRYVRADRCTACGKCAEACVLAGQIPDEFNAGLSRRSAIYLPFAEAYPPVYTVDPQNCLYLKEGKCGEGDTPPCVAACPEGAVDFSQKEEELERKFGVIIVATGFDLFDARLKPELGYGRYPNVITALEFERLASPDGPTGGEIIVNGKKPQSVVFIHCVGSRDKTVGNPYCSRICCMFTAKQALLVKEKLPEAKVTVFYMDVRSFTKGGEEFYDRARGEGVLYRRGSVSEIYRKGDKLIVRADDTLLGRPVEVEADLVVLATGLVPRKETEDVALLLKLARSADGFLAEAHPKLRPVDTASDGIFLAGTCQGPKDIADSVAQARAAASSALMYLIQGKAKVEAVTSKVDPEICSGCGLCEAACAFGALKLDPKRKVMTVNAVLCKGCGACAVACPSKAIQLSHFTPAQTMVMVEALV